MLQTARQSRLRKFESVQETAFVAQRSGRRADLFAPRLLQSGPMEEIVACSPPSANISSPPLFPFPDRLIPQHDLGRFDFVERFGQLHLHGDLGTRAIGASAAGSQHLGPRRPPPPHGLIFKRYDLNQEATLQGVAFLV
jgi:hypothetical protein